MRPAAWLLALSCALPGVALATDPGACATLGPADACAGGFARGPNDPSCAGTGEHVAGDEAEAHAGPVFVSADGERECDRFVSSRSERTAIGGEIGAPLVFTSAGWSELDSGDTRSCSIFAAGTVEDVPCDTLAPPALEWGDLVP